MAVHLVANLRGTSREKVWRTRCWHTKGTPDLASKWILSVWKPKSRIYVFQQERILTPSAQLSLIQLWIEEKMSSAGLSSWIYASFRRTKRRFQGLQRTRKSLKASHLFLFNATLTGRHNDNDHLCTERRLIRGVNPLKTVAPPPTALTD